MSATEYSSVQTTQEREGNISDQAWHRRQETSIRNKIKSDQGNSRY